MISMYREVSGSYEETKDYNVDDSKLPISTVHDGVLGETVETLLYVKNDDILVYYTDVKVTPVSKVTPSIVDGTSTGFGVKLSLGNTQPTEAEWAVVDYGNTIELDDLGSASAADLSARPFWVRIEIPAGTSADNKEQSVLYLEYTEGVVSP